MAPLHPFLPVPGVIRTVLEGTQAGRPWCNVYHSQYTGGPPTADELATWLATWETAVVGVLAPIAHTTVTYTGAQATDLSSISAAQVAVGDSTAGTLAGDTIPSNSCALVNYNSSFRYRGGHPRTYLVAGNQSSLLNPNTWTDAFHTFLTTAAADVFGSFAEGGSGGFVPGQQCAVSYWSADVRRTTPLVMPIATLSVSSGLATQRRRMRK